MHVQRWAAWVAACAVAGVLAGCRRTEETPSRPPRAVSTLVLGTTQEPSTLDPAFSVRSGAQAIVRLLYPDLVVFDDQGTVRPRLAAERPAIRTSSSGTSVSWTLPEEARWSDGQPLAASDALFGWTIEADARLEAVNQELASEVLNFSVRGPRRFEVLWPPGQRGVADPRVHVLLPAHAYPEPKGPGFRGLGVDIGPSSGPYRVERWDPGRELVMVPNPGWAGERPAIERLVWRFFPSPDGFEPALAAGELDALGPASGLDHAMAARLGERLAKTHDVVSTPSGLLLQLTPRLDHPLIGSIEVRRAIDRAIDREKLAELVYGGRARPARGLFGPIHPARPVDIEARPAGTPVAQWAPVELGFASDSPAATRAATYLGQALAKAGLPVRLAGLPLRSLYQKVREGEGPPLTLFAWRTRPDWSGRGLLHTDGRINHAGFSDPNVDRWLDEAEHTVDEGAWVALLRQVDTRVRDQLPFIPLVFRDDVSLRPKALEGWRPTGTTTPVTWNAERWRWREAAR